MSSRLRLIIIIVCGLLIVSGVVLIVVYPRLKGLQPSSNLPPTTTPVARVTNAVDTSNFDASKLPSPAPIAPAPVAPLVTPVEVEKKGVEGYARIFAQIYGTYSSDNNFQNIKDIQSVVTPSLWSKIKPVGTSKPTASFTSVTTQVLMSNLVAWTGTAATVSLEAQRTENRDGKTTTFNQKATVTLVKDASKNTWLVDTFVWQKL